MSKLRLCYHSADVWRICVPADIVRELLQVYHNHGHPRAPKLLSLVKRRFCFSFTETQLHQECLDICQRCQVCQAVKHRRGKAPNTLDFFPIPEDIFSSICMDFLSLEACIGADNRKYDQILVVVCRLSGYIIAIPCEKAGLSAESLARIFLDRVVCLMG